MTSKLVLDREVAPHLGVSRSFLQKDRITKQLIPFYRIGGKVLYDPAQARAALESYRVGGPSKKRGAA